MFRSYSGIYTDTKLKNLRKGLREIGFQFIRDSDPIPDAESLDICVKPEPTKVYQKNALFQMEISLSPPVRFSFLLKARLYKCIFS